VGIVGQVTFNSSYMSFYLFDGSY